MLRLCCWCIVADLYCAVDEFDVIESTFNRKYHYIQGVTENKMLKVLHMIYLDSLAIK